MNKVKIVVRIKDQVHEINYFTETSLMRAMQESGIPLLAICDGNLSCATCQVYIDSHWLDKIPSPMEEEEGMLDLAPDAQPNSRLACQIILTSELDGLSLELAPSSFLQT